MAKSIENYQDWDSIIPCVFYTWDPDVSAKKYFYSMVVTHWDAGHVEVDIYKHQKDGLRYSAEKIASGEVHEILEKLQKREE